VKIKEPTLTVSGIPAILGDFDTLCDALDYAAKGDSGLSFYSARAELVDVLSYAEMREKALDLAYRLCAVTDKGDRIGLVAETGRDFAIAFYACQYAGVLAVPISMPTSMGGKDMYEDQIQRIAATAGLHSLLAPDSVENLVHEALDDTDVIVGPLSGDNLIEKAESLRPFTKDEMCYVQFSSGSTSNPKGILGSQKSVTTNCRALIQFGMEVREGDRTASWLPWYHDMGLIGFFLSPMMAQVSVDCLSPMSFARRPSSWLQIISDNHVTLSCSPSFGYEITAKRWRGGDLDLSRWRVAAIGGDMIRNDALKRFAEVFADSGFSEKAFLPCYGLAEATVAVSFAKLDQGLMTDVVDAHEMRATNIAVPAPENMSENERRCLVGCGRTFDDHEIMICDRDGNRLKDRQVGRVMFRGASVSPGILDMEKGVVPLVDENGWLDTGDLGYWLNAELIITGRHKDLILWNGRNIWPQDIEWAAEKAGGRHVKRAAAFELTDNIGDSGIYLLAECKSRDESVKAKVTSDITVTVRQIVGAPVSVILVPTNSLVMTSSGKLSRMRSRGRYLSGSLSQQAVTQPDTVETFA
jgi:fatty-acyl-CoA synthase